MRVLGAIRNKRLWFDKIRDSEIEQKWRDEALAELQATFGDSKFCELFPKAETDTKGQADEDNEQLPHPINDATLTAVVKYAFDELHYECEDIKQKTRENDAEHTITRAAVDGVFQSDDLIPDALKQTLLDAVGILEEEQRKAGYDWHPDSNEQVLDLIHPSLYCYVVTPEEAKQESKHFPGKKSGFECYIETPEAERVGLRRTLRHRAAVLRPEGEETPTCFWLPAEFEVLGDKHVIIQSLIPNLHPRHKVLEDTIAKVFKCFLPLLSATLGELRSSHFGKPRIHANIHTLYDRVEDEFHKSAEKKIKETLKRPADWTEDEYEDAVIAFEDDMRCEWWPNRRPDQPNVPDFHTELLAKKYDAPLAEVARKIVGLKELGYSQDDVKRITQHVLPAPSGKASPQQFTLRSNVQVIVKIANIVLTPEKPDYPGGSWHVEGVAEEHIIASGIYYLYSRNITESRLAFRCAVEEPRYEQNDTTGVLDIYGLENEKALNQNLGSVETIEGRCIAFPNVLQHCVQPFSLEDKAQRGERKILVFFVVDPSHTITSTLDIPLMRRDWLLELLEEILEMPVVLHRIIADYMPDLVDRDEALRRRKQLMKERKYFITQNTAKMFERPFSLCEH